jgi:hypothetical protein
MYHNCIFCPADLGGNDALERFPVGKRIAFDAARGRLWAVCPGCARWNLAPLHERWEAIEDAERLFRETRSRVQRENIGLAKTQDGTRLVRVGKAVAGELAAWRYGRKDTRRSPRHQIIAGGGALAVSAASTAALAAVTAAGPVFMGTMFLAWGYTIWHVIDQNMPLFSGHIAANRPVYQGRVRYNSRDVLVRVLGKHLPSARLHPDYENRDIELHVPAVWGGFGAERFGHDVTDPLVLRGNDAAAVMGRAMVGLNWLGAKPSDVQAALWAIESAGSPRNLLLEVARRRCLLNGVEVPDWLPVPYDARYTDPLRADTMTTLALEMAVHEETERRAMEGELAGLEEMWRQAEEIASIADRLPDDVGPSEPPRITSV